jgi:hypothetical protein
MSLGSGTRLWNMVLARAGKQKSASKYSVNYNETILNANKAASTIRSLMR